ncbi:hypothetical protein LIER_33447 [Lithospermum erythrorhizon]|uniref:BSD domain-containing protein n=1 Tax=Lithospermum erythrorhizon TaxID=34254 RepID=A0AAV3RXP0_LITER
MELWQKARSFAEETASRTSEAAKGLGSARLSNMVTEATKKSKEIATEASKRAEEIKLEALKRADQIKSQIPDLTNFVDGGGVGGQVGVLDLEMFGVTEELREFVKGITSNTFRDFPLPDDSVMSDIPTVSNVRQDLTQWQEKHAKLVLLSVKGSIMVTMRMCITLSFPIICSSFDDAVQEISKLRYELCPRIMRERKFWRIYFILVNSHLEPYEKRFMEEEQQKSAVKETDDVAKETLPVGVTTNTPAVENTQKTRSGTLSASEQDLDVFLLGDTGDSDEGPDDRDDAFDDDFDKL